MNKKALLVAVITCVVVGGLWALYQRMVFVGYCQYAYSEKWLPNNKYPCSFWHFLTTKNTKDHTIYFNTPMQ